ncbi:uncharacterized protein LACBIDRAFT_313094 [Laccaria bicolor S238N-H82]|uniref:Predicted protein n=1 Tax=Laccaria bicolor (strain S238N-H82 / ATCC MYA-4686) TaxID=486041 RepID=B0DXI6_LACBS|nr:uncharacterized protein LACBIDRAFT_313094 [Laccaria bicolor S238N-H82]EDR00626.1 predicted protein [Laccaria bicolor S238N-H82]|eukprot:XP_001888635.1 predicted protein [Laccaria bicolor S238N-H82]
MDTNDSASCSETNMLRIQLIKKDEMEGTLRKKLRDKAIALEVAEEKVRRLVAASQKQAKAESSVIAGSSSNDTGRNAKSKPNGGTTAPKSEPISPQRRMVLAYVDLPPPSRPLSTQPRTAPPPPPRHQNHESSTLDEMEVENTPSMSPPLNMKLEPKSPHKHKRLIPYVSVPSPPYQNRDVEEMEVEVTPSMSPPPNMKLEPKSPHRRKRLIPYVRVPSPPPQNHDVEEMEVEVTPSMSPPPNMKLEPKSPHRRKRLIPYVRVPSPQPQNHDESKKRKWK